MEGISTAEYEDLNLITCTALNFRRDKYIFNLCKLLRETKAKEITVKKSRFHDKKAQKTFVLSMIYCSDLCNEDGNEHHIFRKRQKC